jgi:hypothetical protein
MMKNMFAAICLSLLCACASVPGYPKRIQTTAAQLTELGTYFTIEKSQEYDAATNGDKWVLRDQILNARILAIDLNFHNFEQAVAGENVRANLYSDIAVITAGTAGALVPAASTARLLSALAAGITGARGAVNKDVFFDKTLQVLLVQMQSSRKEVLTKLVTGMSQSPEIYSLMQGLIDIEDYYDAGTIPGALQAISVQAGVSAQSSAAQLKALKIARPAQFRTGMAK